MGMIVSLSRRGCSDKAVYKSAANGRRAEKRSGRKGEGCSRGMKARTRREKWKRLVDEEGVRKSSEDRKGGRNEELGHSAIDAFGAKPVLPSSSCSSSSFAVPFHSFE